MANGDSTPIYGMSQDEFDENPCTFWVVLLQFNFVQNVNQTLSYSTKQRWFMSLTVKQKNDFITKES